MAIILAGALAVTGALWVFKRQPQLEMSHSLLMCSITLLLLCLGLGLGSDASLIRSGAWMCWPVSGWWLASTFGRKSRRHIRARRFLAISIMVLVVIGLSIWGNPYAVSGVDDLRGSWGRWCHWLELDSGWPPLSII